MVSITELSCAESVHLIAFISAVVFGEPLVFDVFWMRIIQPLNGQKISLSFLSNYTSSFVKFILVPSLRLVA
jgi:hypothetical protein